MISAIALFLPLMVGGDHFSLFRIYQPFAPILLLLLFNRDFIRRNLFDWEIKRPLGLLPRFFLPALLLPVVYLMNMPRYFLDRQIPFTSFMHEFYAPYLCRQASVDLNRLFDFSPRPSIGRILAGGYAFFYEGPTVDLMGLNNTLMAHANGPKDGLKNHASFDKPTFYKLRPDFVDGDFVRLNFNSSRVF